MKKSLLTLVFVAFTFLTFAQKIYLEKSFTAAEFKKINLNLDGGAVYVKGEKGAKPNLKIIIQSNKNREFEAKDIEKYYTIEVKVLNNELLVKAFKKDKKSYDYPVNAKYELVVNYDTDIEINTAGGQIKLENLEANINFKTSGGSLDLIGLAGNVKGNTSGGSISLANSKGEIDLQTSGGSIKAINSNGNIKLQTSGGSLTLNELKGDVKASTSGGSVSATNFDGSLNTSTSGGSMKFYKFSGDLVASTSGGSIELDIKTMGKIIDLSTSAGNIRANVPMNQGMDLDLKGMKIKSNKLSKFSNDLSKGKVRGKVNGGGTKVKMSTSVGTIYID